MLDIFLPQINKREKEEIQVLRARVRYLCVVSLFKKPILSFIFTAMYEKSPEYFLEHFFSCMTAFLFGIHSRSSGTQPSAKKTTIMFSQSHFALG